MDKETLSNYGWIVIAVLVLVVMIALATPFGSFVSEAVQSTTKGLFDVNKNALDAAGVPGLTVQDQEFDVPDMNHGANTPVSVVGSATFNAKTTEGCNCLDEDGYHTCFVSIEPVTLTWEELQLEENGTKYGYDAAVITDTSIGYNAFSCCETITSITIPDSVTSIGNYAFFCTFLTSIGPVGSGASVEIPDGVTSIGQGAFSGCESLTSIDIPDSVTAIGSHTFYSCTSLTSIDLPEGVTSIGQSAFSDCSSLTSITIPNSVTSIGQSAFSNTALTSIDLPISLTSIAGGAFSGCTSLDSVTFKGTVDQWNQISFGANWYYNTLVTEVICSDGTVSLS